MTVIQFVNKHFPLENNQKEGEVEKEDELQSENPENLTSQKNSQVAYLKAKKIIHFSRFLQIKQNHHKDKENTKLRDGLVLKIHNLRKEFEENLQANHLASAEIMEEVLVLASNYADSVLYDDVSALDLLNKYWLFKKNIQALNKKYISNNIL